MAQCVASIVPVHGTLSLFPNTYRFFDPSSIFVRFSVQNWSRRPIDHVVVVRCMVSQSWFVLFRQTCRTLLLISCHIASPSWQEPEEEEKKLLLRKVSAIVINQPMNMFHHIENSYLVYRLNVASPSRRTTNRPWKGRGYVTWHVFIFGCPIYISGMAEAAFITSIVGDPVRISPWSLGIRKLESWSS